MKIKARTFDEKFDHGEDVTQYLDWSKASRPGLEQRRVNVDFPVWMIEALDREASRLGVPRQSLIKMLIGQHLDDRRARLQRTATWTDQEMTEVQDALAAQRVSD
jgi:predicted DNA binding CopG/RHH family protein